MRRGTSHLTVDLDAYLPISLLALASYLLLFYPSYCLPTCLSTYLGYLNEPLVFL